MHNKICYVVPLVLVLGGSSIGTQLAYATIGQGNDYKQGFHDVAAAERKVSGGAYGQGESFDLGPGCPAGHSQEYCMGYKAGWEAEYTSEAE